MTDRSLIPTAVEEGATPVRAATGSRADVAPPPRRAVSIRVIVAIVVVLPVAAVAVALVMLSGDTSRRIAEELATTLTTSATDRVRDDLETFLGHAIEVSDRYAHRVRDGRLPVAGDLTAWRQPMFDDLLTTPNVASICFGTPAGDAVWLLRGQNAPLELGYASGAKDGEAIEFPVDVKTGLPGREPIRVYRYDPRLRPWYATATNAIGPLWTSIYFWFGEAGEDRTTGTGYTRIVRDADGKLLGVLVIDVTLNAITEAVKRLPIARAGGFAFIVDERGLLVAASRGRVNSASGRRLTLAETGDEYARGVASLPYMSDAASTTIPVHTFDVGKARARAIVRSLSPHPGIHWRVIVGAPESVFLADAQKLQRRQVAMASVAAGGSAVLALLLGRQLVRPLLRLRDHVRRVGRGDLDTRLELHATRELAELSHELNRMSAGLKERIELERSLELAKELQQSLLPSEVPTIQGVELAAHCQYCDATGGDYYDFINLNDDPGGATVVAIADAVGHGIPSALLMATARAALRASPASGADESLGRMMTRVNSVLCHGARSGRFMTMLLMCLDAPTRTLRWARAGHEPFLLYNPATDTFGKLPGGGYPLGIEINEYDEYAHASLEPGTLIVAATDGLWEATNAAGEMFGRERVRDTLRDVAGSGASARSMVEAIERELKRFLAGTPIKDDVTLIVMRVVD